MAKQHTGQSLFEETVSSMSDTRRPAWRDLPDYARENWERNAERYNARIAALTTKPAGSE